MKRIVVAIALLALGAGPGEDWKRRLDRSAAHLKAGELRKSLRVTDLVLLDMTRRLGSGPAPTEILGVALTHKALALAGQGKRDDALWWWHVVLTMTPPFAKSDLAPFGDAGAFLAANRELPNLDDLPQFDDNLIDVPGITAPRHRRKPLPQYPDGAEWFQTEGTLVVQVVVRRDGTVAWPRVVQSTATPTFVYVTMAAMKNWTFEPAKRNGTPVDSRYVQTVNYRIRRPGPSS